uniref:Hypothetical secreted peptide n=1 Tax=Glossina morsitans morsitans TaxID=37546 RepID=D3TSK2_GLOMM
MSPNQCQINRSYFFNFIYLFIFLLLAKEIYQFYLYIYSFLLDILQKKKISHDTS